jgi:hypothetical protein
MSDRIKPHHLGRKAILYVRQSSAHQVTQTAGTGCRASGCGRAECAGHRRVSSRSGRGVRSCLYLQ